MRTLIVRAFVLAGGLLLAGCSSTRSLPKYEKPLSRAAVMSVRTTAYTHSESDHLRHGRQTALGTTLRSGPIHSAAADWSRWPAGSIFRIRETGEIFEVDDYGWALAGTNTIDLYKPSRRAMNTWGVRRVTIENLRWGDPRASVSVLRPRARHRHVKRMLDQLEDSVAQWNDPAPAPPEPAMIASELTPDSPPPPRATAIASNRVASAQPPRAAPVTRSSGSTATREAFLNSVR